MDLTKMFLDSPDWVKAIWVVCMTTLALGFPLVIAALVKSIKQPSTAHPPSAPVVTLLPERPVDTLVAIEASQPAEEEADEPSLEPETRPA